MKTIGKIATGIFVVAVIGALCWLMGAGFKGKTLKDTLPGQKQEQIVEDENQNNENQENENQDNTENGDETGSDVETTSIKYIAEENTICLG